MSGFGFNGFGANNNNQQQGTGFGGFGSNNTGFGQQQSTGFGATSNNAGGSLFGSGAPAFGASNSTPFGAAKPAFGTATTSSGGLFGSSTATTGGTGFGGFGSNTTNTNNTSSPFGSGNNGGGLFGSGNKAGFGAGNNTGGGLFGGGNTGTFGQSNSQPSTLFSAPQSTALGGNLADCQGTGGTPFQAFTEKDGPNGAATNHFQTISFMGPYQKYSLEELRLADYAQGRRFGNNSGQPGAFGVGTGFGGFGQSTQNTGTGFGAAGGGGLFGSTPASSSSPFGATTQTTGAFGAGSTSLFGNKPPANNLFGSTPAATASQPTGGLFGTSGQTGFGSQQGTAFGANTGGGLFGNNNNTQQATKPGFSFGANSTTATTGTGFGNTNAFGSGTTTSGGGGLFGQSNQSTSLFGQSQQQQSPATNPFGGATQQAQPAFGGFGANNAQKPGGLFGNNNTTSNTGSGLFGGSAQNNQATTTGGLFGNTNQTSSNSLFAPKPAATGTSGLFGNTNSNNSTGLFGGFNNNNNNNNQTQQNQGGGGLFGNTNNQQQKPSLFSNPTSNTGSLFNNNNNNSTTNPSFTLGTNTNQTQQSGASLFSNMPGNNGSSLFGNSQQNALQPPGAMTASIFDRNPYGSSSIFSGLPPPPQASPGPIATPISAGQPKPKKLAPLPQYKINPSMASRLVTPQKRGFGFSYSTYGTPNSVSSNVSTPGGLSSSLLGSSIGRSLGKSFSTSNLRRNFDNDADSILSPGAFSAGSTRYSGTGSMKRLLIDRSLRTDLFGGNAVAALPSPDKTDQSKQPNMLKKKVSFDASTMGGNGCEIESNGISSESSVFPEISATPSAQEQGYLRSSPRRPNGSRLSAIPAQSEMEQIKGNELAVVHEDDFLDDSNVVVTTTTATLDQSDPEPGNYYMKPPREQLRKLSQDKLRRVSGFEVGRERCGHVVFDQPVDLTTVDLDNLYDNIVVITLRSLTVYPETAQKPPEGKGLNVPSTITLQNSWPRQRDRKTPSYEKSGPRFAKHIDRLRGVTNTEFVKYDKETGEWVFRVPHFTTYALDFDDDGSEGESLLTSVLSEAPNTPTPKSRSTPQPTRSALESSLLTEEPSQVSSDPDDTFDFRRKVLFPGAYDGTPAFEDDEEMEVQRNESFLGDGSALSTSDDGAEEPGEYEHEADQFVDQSLIVRDEDMEMAGSFPENNMSDGDSFPAQPVYQPKSILKASQGGKDTPTNIAKMGNNWAEQLQRTISPKKKDRQVLRENQARLFREDDYGNEDTPTAKFPQQELKRFTTSIDLMNSLFGKEEARKSGSGIKLDKHGEGFKWPYPKKHINNYDHADMPDTERAYHNSFKSTWGPGEILVYAVPRDASIAGKQTTSARSIISKKERVLESEGREIYLAELRTSLEINATTFSKQRERSEIFGGDGVPYAVAKLLPFKIGSSTETATGYEALVWELASILFDDDRTKSSSSEQMAGFEHRVRKDHLSTFWSRICQDQALTAVASAPTAEERAIAYLSMHNVMEACDALIEGKDFRLANLVAQIGGDAVMHADMATQIGTWRRLNVLSEIADPIRALYEILAGNTCVCEGKSKTATEDHVGTYVISERFKLDWRRAFGLRLWYAIQDDEPIETAVRKFTSDLQDKETKHPLPWFIQDGVSLPWNDKHSQEREDLLWGILKLYADIEDDVNTIKLVDMIMPQNVTENPMDFRLSFELYHAISTRFPAQSDPARADRLAWEFATQLEAAGKWHWAMFVLLHLSNPLQRQKALQTILSHHVSDISESDTEHLQILTDTFKIPEAWIWEAKALYARSVLEDYVKEVDYLLRAKNWNEAHKTLCHIVAPLAIIEEDYETLFQLLENFGRKDKVSNWNLGGQVYQDYVHLIKGMDGRMRPVVLKRLLGSLTALIHDRPGRLGFAEMVAVQEMSAVVGKAILEDETHMNDGLRVLQLPMTGDKHLQHTVDLSLNYYKALMSQGY